MNKHLLKLVINACKQVEQDEDSSYLLKEKQMNLYDVTLELKYTFIETNVMLQDRLTKYSNNLQRRRVSA